MRMNPTKWALQIFKLEMHEIASAGMIVFLIFLYQMWPQQQALWMVIRDIVVHSGPITLTIAALFVIFLVRGIVTKTRTVPGHAYTMMRIMLSFLVMLIAFEVITRFLRTSEASLDDGMLQNWDRILFFGKQAAERLQIITNPVLTLFLSAVYLAWFALTYGTIFFMMRKWKQAVLEYATTTLVTFYIGYIGYCIVPAYGPVFTYTFSTTMGGLTGLMSGGSIFQPVADAFPSLHTAIAFVMAVQAKRYIPKLYYAYAVASLLIIFSTVYLRIHYAVDVIAGIILALITTTLCPLALKAWDSVRKFPIRERSDLKARSF